ncbi:MAG: CFI-box-CTERM domain-containing protein [Nitrosopumilaceae archaeon]
MRLDRNAIRFSGILGILLVFLFATNLVLPNLMIAYAQSDGVEFRKARVAEAEMKVEQAKQKVDDAKQLVKQAEAQVAKEKTEVDEVKAQLEQVQNDPATDQAKVTAVENKLLNEMKQLAEARTDLGKARDQLEVAEAQLKAAEDELQYAKRQLDIVGYESMAEEREAILKTGEEYFTNVGKKQAQAETNVGAVGSGDISKVGCLIATATFGSELAPEVQTLRETRDNIILQTESGKAFMKAFNSIYYSFSPTVADWERENPIFKEAVKVTITPLLATLSILSYVDIDSEAEMLAYGIGIISLNIGMYFVAPVFAITRLKNH